MSTSDEKFETREGTDCVCPSNAQDALRAVTRLICPFFLDTAMFKLRLASAIKLLLLLAVIGIVSQSILLYLSYEGTYDPLPQVLSQTSLHKAYALWHKLPSISATSQEQSVTRDTPTFVITLQARKDRQKNMEKLRERLGMRWIYVGATEATSPLTRSLMQLVRQQRNSTHRANATTKFLWPGEGAQVHTANPFWIDPSEAMQRALQSDMHESEPLTCATEDDTLQPYNSTLPEYRILTPERIAVWNSHISLLRAIRAQSSVASSGRSDAGIAALILEDDVSAEYDLVHRLDSIWAFVPTGWDIVFLGTVPFLSPRHISGCVSLTCGTPQDTAGQMKPSFLLYHPPPSPQRAFTRPTHPNAPTHTPSPPKAPESSSIISSTRPSRTQGRWTRRWRGLCRVSG